MLKSFGSFKPEQAGYFGCKFSQTPFALIHGLRDLQMGGDCVNLDLVGGGMCESANAVRRRDNCVLAGVDAGRGLTTVRVCTITVSTRNPILQNRLGCVARVVVLQYYSRHGL